MAKAPKKALKKAPQKAPKKAPKKATKRRLILIESTEPVESIKKKLRAQGIREVEEIELWVRTPDDPRLERVRYAARLCSCTTVCIPQPPPPPVG